MSTPDTLESRIEQKATKYAIDLGMMHLKLNVTGQAGWPDHLYVWNGKVLFVEYKAPRQKPRPLQMYVHQQLADRGIQVHVIDNLIDAKELINEFYS